MAYCGCSKSATSPIFSDSSAMLTFDEFGIGCWNIALLPPLVNDEILPAEFRRTLCGDAIPFTAPCPICLRELHIDFSVQYAHVWAIKFLITKNDRNGYCFLLIWYASLWFATNALAHAYNRSEFRSMVITIRMLSEHTICSITQININKLHTGISSHLPIEPFAFTECAFPFAVWNEVELELVPSKTIWLLEAALILLVLFVEWLISPLFASILWSTVCTDVVLDTDDWCWNMCWWEWCKLFVLDFVRFNGNNAISFSSESENKNNKIVLPDNTMLIKR